MKRIPSVPVFLLGLAAPAAGQTELGKRGVNPYAPDSTASPYGAGSPYRADSPANRYGKGWRIVRE